MSNAGELIVHFKTMGALLKELFKLFDLIRNGDARCVQGFLNNNSVDINIVLPCKGIGILHLAVGVEPLEKSKQCTEIILKHGGDPNLCNDDGITPVHIAAIWGRVDNLKLLIGCGGDPSQRDLDGLSAFDYAAREQQWDVYDYLHNVVDQTEDCFGSQCAYTLDLERVIMTTDQIVAAYEPTDKQFCNTTCRKSDLVREWFDKHNFTLNKLYPTILSEAQLTDDESAVCKDIDFKKIDLSDKKSHLNDTETTLKTCLSTKNVNISGVHTPLEITKDETKDISCCCQVTNSSCNIQKQQINKNFSLPGSPIEICHKNYDSKTNLKNCKSYKECRACLKSDSLKTNHHSLQRSLDKALAVVQNKTNEWLSVSENGQTDMKGTNTRRSSASSGVSSNFSGGSIVIANVREEYKYEDKKEDVVLIERRLLVSSVVLPVDESDTRRQSADQTVVSVASSLPPSMEYDNDTLRAELLKLGFTPGPIRDGTKTLYLKKLQALKKNPIVVNNQDKSYSIELERSLRNEDWMKDLSFYIDLENKARTDFTNPNKKWREGTAKTSFTYLLLDPRLTDNLPVKAGAQRQHATWVTFVNSIFYVGKGKRSRPYSHLYQALTLWKSNFTTSKDKKVQNILDIWSDKLGVVCLHIFQNVIPAEAYTNEAAMIDVLGLANLKNLKSGNYYGVTSSWPLKDRRALGLYLLYKAMLIFLSEGERQLRPDDID